MWAIITGIIFLIAVIVVVVCLFKKFEILGCCKHGKDADFIIDENGVPENGESGVRYTTDQDFV